jgi:hypothetical protein
VFYQVYPQSFFDSNGDGIGDLPGITQKLDYIQSVGCNAIWINPIYESPFGDAGYDVARKAEMRPIFEHRNAKFCQIQQKRRPSGSAAPRDRAPSRSRSKL